MEVIMFEENSTIPTAKQEVIDDLLKDLPTDVALEVDLPSENKVYTLEDPAAPITIRPMTFEDEKRIVGAAKNQDPVNMILQRCTTNINIADLLSMDKLFLIMKLREISYGDSYQTLLICQHCKAENPTTVKLSNLNVNPVPDDFVDPVEILLPSINKRARVRLPRVRDEKLFENTEEALSQIWRFVVDIDGHTDRAIVSRVLEKLPIRDMRGILNAMNTEFGVDTKVKFSCTSCEEVSVIDLPIDANFFDVN
jgi:hypothetical protein